MGDDWCAGGFGVYVHWPFCAAKCPYCDFNSHVQRSVDQDRWRDALLAEIARAVEELPGRRVESLYFGGGTPSLMPPETIAAVIAAVEAGWGFVSDAEVTLEANPTSVEAERFAGYRSAGVNRLSLGVQALDDDALLRLGRMHSARDALLALEIARGAFSHVSIDLIYARQGQTVAAWEAELALALALGVDHLSLYQLTIEPGTRFHELRARGRLANLPDGEVGADLYEATQGLCAAAGLPAYEISNHARPGREGRHNRIYWRYGDYVGVGPGAHGRLTIDERRKAVEAVREPEAWLAAVENLGSGEAARATLDGRDQAVEMLIMGLRLVEGIAIDRYTRLAGRPLSVAELGALRAAGFVEIKRGQLRASISGRRVLEAVLERLIGDD